MDDKYRILEDSVRIMFAQAVWTHKIQEKQSDLYQKQYKWMETGSILCASLTSIGILSTIFTDHLWIKIVSAILSFATVFIAAYFKSFDLSKLSGAHKEAANTVLGIRNDYLGLITSIKLKEKTIVDLECEFHKMMKRANDAYNSAPSTTNKAVRLAKKALQITGDNTFTDDEIDSYLPEALQKET